MVQLIDQRMDEHPKSFYNELAADYDGMTGFEHRLSHDRLSFQSLVDAYHLTSALDAGCGTGLHALLLAQLGLHVTAVDISEEMLVRTRAHAKKYGFRIRTVRSTFPQLKNIMTKKFDSVFCLGNTAAHLLQEREFLQSLKSFYVLLERKGIVFLQLLNYDRILDRCERIQSIKSTRAKIFIRFYDFDTNRIRFNILKLETKDGRIAHSLHSVMLRPWTTSEVIRLMKQAGFTGVKVFGSMAQEKYHRRSSQDLVVLAHRM